MKDTEKLLIRYLSGSITLKEMFHSLRHANVSATKFSEICHNVIVSYVFHCAVTIITLTLVTMLAVHLVSKIDFSVKHPMKKIQEIQNDQ